MKKSIGIIGGMGPMATVDLYRKIVACTDASCDNDHVRVYIDSNAAIPDRTAAILRGGPDPVPQMADSVRKLTACGADCLIMPCNTAHYFLPRLQPLTPVPFLSMLEAAADTCRERFPGKTAGVLATRGTLESGIYSHTLEEHGVPYLLPEEAERDVLMQVIYDGVKQGSSLGSHGGCVPWRTGGHDGPGCGLLHPGAARNCLWPFPCCVSPLLPWIPQRSLPAGPCHFAATDCGPGSSTPGRDRDKENVRSVRNFSEIRKIISGKFVECSKPDLLAFTNCS